MTPQQKAHVTKLQSEATDRIGTKYTKGAQEHGGNIWDLTPSRLINEAIDEAIDQVVYLLTLRDQIVELEDKAFRYDSVNK